MSRDIEAYPLGPLQDNEQAGGEITRPSTDHPGRVDVSNEGEPSAEETRPQSPPTDTPPAADGGTHTDHPFEIPQNNHKVEDFDDSANALWSLYGKEAKGHDQATIQTLKDDMDGVLIFAGLFSAALTAFIIDRCQNIQQTPAQQSVFLQQQTVVLLNQISIQISSLGPLASVSANLTLPSATPSSSDVRVNIYWFMSLVSSLSAALLATLVQRWARDHMYIFQRYSHPLKVARIRQYLHEGVEGWYMPAIAEAVPGLVHISLFLFFLGLADFLLNTHALVGQLTLFPIILCATLYTISSIAPIMYPQAPYRSSFTCLIWYLVRKVHKRLYKDRFGVTQKKSLSSNMANGQMQLAMEKNDSRKGRDERAIRWLVNTLTEDIEMESLASGIPGSFDAKWGVEVWKHDLETRRDGSIAGTPTGSTAHSDPVPQSTGAQPVCGEVVDELCQRVQRLFETCNYRGSFINDDEWRNRSRACVETAASFVFCMDADISSFGKIGKLLSDLGSAERTYEVPATSLNRSFTTRWTCLSLVAIRKMLDASELKQYASGTIFTLGAPDPVGGGYDPFDTALRNARKIDEQLTAAWKCVESLRQEFKLQQLDEDRSGERVEEILRNYEPQLGKIQSDADAMKRVDMRISDLQSKIDKFTHNLTRQLPGVVVDDHIGPTPIAEVFDFLAGPVRPQLIYFSQRLLGLCTLSQKRSSKGHRETTRILKAVEEIPSHLRSEDGVIERKLMERQLWRLQDISIGCAFGFTLELYFISLREILSAFTPQPPDAYIAFYVGAFKAITLDWEQIKHTLGTLQIVLNLVCDVTMLHRGVFSDYMYPDYITKELLDLLGKMVEGQDHSANVDAIDDAIKELRDVRWKVGNENFRASAIEILERRAPTSST
ncbi:hypothetical protein BC827DRAFT_549816 [Russula dissimulans]|nr:hypothetical protein BC827DRAFT_549816 [Russula dissimulans]